MPFNSPSLDLLPSLPLESWQETHTSLHMWTQIVGKIQPIRTFTRCVSPSE
jgi:Family of unknown function (DUF5996)